MERRRCILVKTPKNLVSIFMNVIHNFEKDAFTDRSKVVLLLWIFYVVFFTSVLVLLCLCTRIFICALWSPAGKGMASWLSFVVSNCEFVNSHWYPGSGVVLDCIDS